MVKIFGTLGPSCDDETILNAMFREGMTGIRINLSHVKLSECEERIERIKKAALKCGICPEILIDLQGPELRIGTLMEQLILEEGAFFSIGKGDVPVDSVIIQNIETGQEIMLDDGKILAKVSSVDGNTAVLQVLRGGVLRSRKSISIIGREIVLPALSADDHENIRDARNYGITGVMQPFVRSSSDLIELRSLLDENEGSNIKIYAKIENMTGVNKLTSFFPFADEIIIARGDLGNAMPLWELPKIQKFISKECSAHKMPFMVVTQMLSSMEHSKVPTRAEVCDIYNAVLDGASSVMVTGETAVGEYPVEVIRYLNKTAHEASHE